MTGEIIGAAGMNMATSIMNNLYATRRTIADRAANYKYNEMAAENADARTRALYEDIYSPQALLKNYKKAGLSPSIMYGGTPGQGGMSGAQGNGSSGLQTPFAPISMIEAAQAALLMAQTKKTKAETQNIQQDTTLKEIETAYNNLQLGQYKNEWELLNSTWTDPKTGNETSLFEIADSYYSYEEFLKAIRQKETDLSIKEATTTESGQKTLRTIYESANRFHRDIMILSEETVTSSFQLDIINELKKEDFAKLNAEAAISQLKQSKASNDLTEEQKNAWNRILDRLGKKGSTTKDILIVLGMILGNFVSNTNIRLNTGK